MTCETSIPLAVGSTCKYGFVFKDYLNAPIDLNGSEFFFAVTAPDLTLSFDTTDDPINLFIEEDVVIMPVGEDSYLADRLVLVLPPVTSRLFPLGAITRWEIERRKDGEQRNWGAGLFLGYGGMNIDV